MKILQINSVCGIRSTGRICTDLAESLEAQGHECKVAFGRETVPEKHKKRAIRIGTPLSVKLHGVKARLWDAAGFGSAYATRKFIKWIKEYDPDVIHLHNLHGYYINIRILFDYLKKSGKPVVWTLHDCWAFTGHCSHYAAANCDKWKTECKKCPQKAEYPQSILLDRSRKNFQKKKRCFTSIPNLTVVTPSHWLAEQAKASFLGDYTIKVIQNGIDSSVFAPTQSNFREKFDLENKCVVLGVATAWGEKKGLNKFIELSAKLDPQCKIVLVGLTDAQKATLPQEIIGIERTNDARELAEIYTAADVCLTLSLEETMGLTVVEANACGTPALVLRKTALPELITEQNGIVLEKNDTAYVASVIQSNDFPKQFPADACVNTAQKYKKELKYQEYIEIYKEMVK